MASSDITESGDGCDLYDCQVCLHFMMDKNLRTLHCLHTFCEECLRKLLNNKTIQCPTCRAVTTIAENDINLIPVNFVLNKMKEMNDKMTNMKGVIEEMESTAKTEKLVGTKDCTKCDVCESYKATYKCKQCVQVMCALCKSKHDKITFFKSHTIYKIHVEAYSFCDQHQSK